MKTWTIGQQIAVNCNTTDVPAYHEIIEDGRVIIRVLIHSNEGDKALKYAKITASALDLLDAAKKALEEGQCACSISMRDSGHAVGCWMPDVDENLRSAISKAEAR